ncbi:CCA tRNA nucleotidyltransferase [Epibacterium sp. SM1969]|uniref:CCA tRNA nucleotidyltransferase n=1 Tax=Tritonibacter aquimaris TaxID=2663379 RepID=A0A844AU01_9RHOB|nr:CCA tRNA nucleotidyltransferase [Tritonibacter aquimaris]MQY41884.1 CCA tRNA nucleotidyltransferase [Tritonibacter aquimaris]
MQPRIDQPWLHDKHTQKVCAALTSTGAKAFFVGGCVRNALIGAPVSDLDISTDATPEQVMQLAKAAGIKAIPTGIDHGTITLVSGGIPHEVTTFRKDVATDGRRAVVAFSSDMADDARRRDFTMNALYADPQGVVYDPLGGFGDLNKRRVRFIGTAAHRIQEDYLRILRYFRFHAWYGDQSAGFDEDALAAIATNLEGLAQLSRERVGSEFLKLLRAPEPAPSVACMRQTGVLHTLLNGVDDRALAPLVHLETVGSSDEVDPILRLAALGEDLSKPLRLSNAQDKHLHILRTAALGTAGAAELSYRLGAQDARKAMILRAALLETPFDPHMNDDIQHGAAAKFPIAAQDLMPALSGAQLGQALRQLEGDWIKSGFSLDKNALLRSLK